MDSFSCILFLQQLHLDLNILSISRKNNYIFEQEMLGSVLSKKLLKRSALNDVKINIMTSCMRSTYTPSYKTEISRTDENREKCKNKRIYSGY